jgi:hypothetical protein
MHSLCEVGKKTLTSVDAVIKKRSRGDVDGITAVDTIVKAAA